MSSMIEIKTKQKNSKTSKANTWCHAIFSQ